MSCSGGKEFLHVLGYRGRRVAAGKAVPSNSLRAVRTTPERTTRGGGDRRRRRRRRPAGDRSGARRRPARCPAGQSSVSSWPTAPGSSMPVTTLTAPRTPIEVCGCTGMKERVHDLAAVARRRQQHRLRHRGRRHVPHAHELGGLAPERVDPLEQGGVGGQLLVRLVAGQPERLRQGENDGHAVVDAGDLDALDGVAHVTGGQQRAGRRALGVGERENHGRGRARDAGDLDVAAVLHPSPGRRERGDRDAVGVDHPDPHGGLAVLGGYEAALHRERPDPGEDVAAVLPVADGGLVDPELEEQVVDVDVRVLRRRHDRHLAGQRRRPAQAVDLPGVGGAHEPQQQVVAGRRVGGQVARLEVQPARRAPAQHGAADAGVVVAHRCCSHFS